MSKYPDGTETLGSIPIAGAIFDKGGGIYNVMHPDYGAKGDGATNDLAAIAAACAAADDDADGGGIVLVPGATYNIGAGSIWSGINGVTLLLCPGVVVTGAGSLDITEGSNMIIDLSSKSSFRLKFLQGQILFDGENGIDIIPSSDEDVDLLTVGVTGSPKLSWDESVDKFVLSKGLDPSLNNTHDLGTGSLRWNNGFFNNINASGVATIDQINVGGGNLQADDSSNLAFGGASLQALPLSVTGSRGGNAALANLLTALANVGLIDDSTSA